MRKIAIVIMFAAGCFLLYFGTGMLLLVPGVPGEPYWSGLRALYGLVPAGAGIGILGLAAWLRLAAGSASVGLFEVLRETCVLFALSMVCIILFWTILALWVQR